MAISIEIDNKVQRDSRFDYLGQLTGKGKYDARARLEDVWLDCIESTNDIRTAEEIDFLSGWFDGGQIRFAELLVKAKLAEPVPNGFRLRGVKDRMGWLVDFREKRAKAGSKGGKISAKKAERDETGKFIPQKEPSTSQANIQASQAGTDQIQAPANQNQANPSIPVPVPVSVPVPVPVSGPEPVPVSLSPTKKEIRELERQRKTELKAQRDLEKQRKAEAKALAKSQKAAEEEELKKNASLVIKHYCELWKDLYKTPINFSGEWAGNAKTLVRDHGLKGALRLVESFLQMKDQWFLTKRHAFDVIAKDLAKISHFAGTGVQVSQSQILQFDKQSGNMELLEKVRRGEA